jgi:hypothetical protein
MRRIIMRKRRIRLALVLSLAAMAIAVPLTVIALASAGDERSLTTEATRATARFHDLDAAEQAGYNALVMDVNGLSCIDNQPVGGMGLHYAKPGLLMDGGAIDASEPEALVYAPNAAGKPKLAALEYIVFASDWTKLGHAADDPPKLFGQPYLFTDAPNRFGISAFWALHVWIWQPNPAGTFQPWNPTVHC